MIKVPGKTPDGAFKVLDLLEKGGLEPIVGRKGPYWAPRPSAPLASVIHNAMVPTLSWSREVAPGTSMTDLDANAAYVSAASSATFAHGELTRATVKEDDKVLPGYYLIDAYTWGHGATGSPLGAADLSDSPYVWVSAPTYKLIRDLTQGASWTPPGMWPDDTVYDAWVGESTCRLTLWVDVLRDLRAAFIDTGDGDAYEALKFGYSQAIQMLGVKPDPKGTPAADRQKKNFAYRPDWAHTIRAQHAANMWRRGFQATLAGHPPVALGGAGHMTDGLAFTTLDLTAVLALPKSPIKLDPTRRELGKFHQTRRYLAGEDA